MKFLLSLSICLGFKILIQDFTVMSICPGSGYEVDLLTKGFSDLGLIQNTDYSFECVDSLSTIKTRVSSEDAIGFGGISISSEDILSGYSFTHPTYYSGLNVLIKNVVLQDPFKLFNSLQWKVWVLFAITPLVLGVFSWIYSIIISDSPLTSIKRLNLLQDFIWESYAASMFSSNLLPKTSGRCLELLLSISMYLFFLVLVACYASDNYQLLITFISKFGDLAGQEVLIQPQYKDICGQYLIYYYETSTDYFRSNFAGALQLLDEQVVAGIIADNTFLLANSWNNSEFKINTYPFIRFSYAGIYGAGASNNTVKWVNYALAAVESSAFPAEISEKYNLGYEVSANTEKQVVMSDCVYAFFIIVGGCIVAVGMSALPYKQVYSESWEVCKRRRRYFDELDFTSRTEGGDVVKKNFQGENEQEGDESSWSYEMSEQNIKLLRSSTLSLIEYENLCLEWIEKLVIELREENSEKQEFITKIENFMK